MGYFNTSRRALVAQIALAFWLFAVFVSIANACGLGQEPEHAGPSKALHVGALDKSDDGAMPACEKFCAEDFPLLGKLTAAQDPPTGLAFLTPLAASDFLQINAIAASSLWPHSVPPPILAVNTRFTRLAL